MSRATRLARYTVPRCWVPHNPDTHAQHVHAHAHAHVHAHVLAYLLPYLLAHLRELLEPLELASLTQVLVALLLPHVVALDTVPGWP